MQNDGPVGRARGGHARADSLTPEQRKDIAARAAAARWGEKALQAIRKGNFKEHFGIDVDCYVLDDARKTAVISQTGMARALQMSPRGSSLPSFLASRAMAKSGGGEFLAKIQDPLKFQWRSGGGEAPPTTVHGFDVNLLIDICNGIIAAEAAGDLGGKRYHKITQQAHIIVGASAKAGITGLVYALAGFSPTTEEVIAAFKLYVQEEAKKYEAEFPSELYMQWHRLYEIPIPARGKPWHFKHLTVNHIYYPLAKSNGKIFQLLKALKAKDGDRQKKLFQFLSEIGARALRIQIGRILEMTESSKDKWTYESRIKERFGDQQELELVMPSPPSPSEPPATDPNEPSPPVVQ